MWGSRHLRRGSGWLLIGWLLGGCAVGPNFVRPPAPAVTRYAREPDLTSTVAARGSAQQFAAGGAVNARWWQQFDSPQLDALVEAALARNPGLEAARASLAASELALRSGYGIFYPGIAADAGATRERSTPLRFGQSGSASVFNLFSLSASIDYALDAFGGQRRLIEQLRAQADLQRASAAAAYLTLTSNLVQTAITAAAYRAELEATTELVDLVRSQVEIAQVQAAAGTAPYSAVLSLQGELASYQATIPQLQQKLAQAQDLLATLAGRFPAEASLPSPALEALQLPATLPISVPAALLEQRPDIRMAEAASHAASAGIGIATAAMLPSVTLSGSLGATSLTSASLFAARGRTWSVGADAAMPVFAGGTLWYRRRAAIEAYRQTQALYRQTVLAAFGQVADVLQALEHDATALAAQDAALAASQQALQLMRVNYAAGLATYLDVLAADAQYHQASIADLQAVAVRLQDSVALYAALGGGWDGE